MKRIAFPVVLILFLGFMGAAALAQAPPKKLPRTYADGPLDPYYPHRDYPKLITPQWVGEEGVECVVTLAIDDMRESAKYETYLRPILDRLKQIDGRAPVSIMSCSANPMDPQLKKWLAEGLSIEVHTFDHPCPCLQGSDFAKAKATYEKCVDLMHLIPGNKPVAFRMPCCDSKNTPSPRFWQHVFNETTPYGNFLQIDSSVFNIITKDDSSLPKEIRELEDGSERFRRYLPFPNFVNTINDYPYPYVIGGVCWEFPCVVPSDWSAQHVQKPYNPDTVRDLKLALDAAVIKQGTFNLVFHPHGWIRNGQVVELIDHAVKKHGKKVKFLNFRECLERLNKNLLNGESLRLADGKPNPAIQLADHDQDQYLDVVFNATEIDQSVRLWQPKTRNWKQVSSKFTWAFHPIGFHRDVDGDGTNEWVAWNPFQAALAGIVPDTMLVQFEARDERGDRKSTGLKLPSNMPFLFRNYDNGVRLVDVNGDSKLDLVQSVPERYAIHLFKDWETGWSIKVLDEKRGDPAAKKPVIPPFIRADGTNNGVWFHSGAIWLQNEDTAKLPDGVEKVLFKDLLDAR
jgi:hypothetical protein